MKTRTSRLWLTLAVVGALPTAGCGTIGWMVTSDQGGNHPVVYGGVHFDLTEIRHYFQTGNPAVGVLLVLDLPVSFVADTLLLPLIGFGYWDPLHRRKQSAPQEGPAEGQERPLERR